MPNRPDEPMVPPRPDDAAEDETLDLSFSSLAEVEAMDQWLEVWTKQQRRGGLPNRGPASSVAELFSGMPSPRPKFMTQLWDRLAALHIAPLSRSERRAAVKTKHDSAGGGTMTVGRGPSTLVANPDVIRVLIVEREQLFRRGLAGALSAGERMEVVGSVGAAEEGYRLADEASPDVALVGTTLAEAPGLSCATEMRRRFPALATIVVAANESDDELFAAIRAGASAYCGKDIAEDRLIELIERSATGEYVINEQLLDKPYVAARVLEQFRTTHAGELAQSSAFAPLTDRELEILRKVSDGLTNAEIGYALGISAQTVKNHVTSILRKLAVNDRTQAVVTALRRGWLSIDEQPGTGTTGPAPAPQPGPPPPVPLIERRARRR
jgi:DNA-binding NarL/FixJ family response regulator